MSSIPQEMRIDKLANSPYLRDKPSPNYMQNRFSAQSLFAFVLCISLSSCTLIQDVFNQSIDNFGGQLSTVDSTVYDTLNYYKVLTEDIGRRAQPLVGNSSDRLPSLGIQERYDAVHTSHNDLVASIARRIRVNQAVELKDINPELSQLRQQRDALVAQFREAAPSSDPRQIPEELKELGLEVLQELGEFLVRKQYSKAFEQRYKVMSWEEIQEVRGER